MARFCISQTAKFPGAAVWDFFLVCSLLPRFKEADQRGSADKRSPQQTDSRCQKSPFLSSLFSLPTKPCGHCSRGMAPGSPEALFERHQGLPTGEENGRSKEGGRRTLFLLLHSTHTLKPSSDPWPSLHPVGNITVKVLRLHRYPSCMDHAWIPMDRMAR